jgi:hypothetical protein
MRTWALVAAVLVAAALVLDGSRSGVAAERSLKIGDLPYGAHRAQLTGAMVALNRQLNVELARLVMGQGQAQEQSTEFRVRTPLPRSHTRVRSCSLLCSRADC